ncbi:MAG: hypothetical protein AAF483_10915 [Planctomycetota bacterium]
MTAFRPKIVLLAATIWAGLFFSALQVAKLELGYFPFLCGNWGCLPETAPLLSVHLMWLVLLGGGFVLLSLVTKSWAKAHPWCLGSAIALILMSGFLGRDYIVYLQLGGEFDSGIEVLKFLAFHTVLKTDIPMLELFLVQSFQALVAWNASQSQL